MPAVDPVILRLQTDLSDYNAKVAGAAKLSEQQLDRIEKAGESVGKSIRASFTKIGEASATAGSSIGGLAEKFSLARVAAAGFVGSIVIDKIVEATVAGLEYASSLGETAQQLGVTSAALQEYRYSATQVGVSAGDMDQALAQLTRRIGEGANGTKAQAEAFDKLGISLKDAGGHIIATGDAIPKIADGLSKIQDPAERATILMDLFGRSGQKLEPLLSGGAAGVDALRQAAHDLGIVLSDQQIQNADNTADKLAEVKLVLQANIAGVVANNANSILQFANALEHLALSAVTALNAVENFYQSLPSFGSSGLDKNHDGYIGSDESVLGRLMGNRTPNAKGAGQGVSSLIMSAANTALDAATAAQRPTPFVPNYVPKARAAGGSGGGSASAAASGPSDAERAKAFDDQRANIARQALSSMEQLAKSAEERAEYEMRGVELARLRSIADINANKNLTAAQKAVLLADTEQAAQSERDLVRMREQAQKDQDAADIASQTYDNQRDALQSQADLATTQAERQKLALQMVDLEYQYLRSVQEAIIASTTATDAEKKRAQLIVTGLDANVSAKRAAASQANEGPLAAYSRKLNDADIGDQVQDYAVTELQSLRDSLHAGINKVIGTKDPFLNGLINILIEQIVLKPLANALANASSGGGSGLFGTLLSGLGSLTGGGASLNGVTASSTNFLSGPGFGRASGGSVSGGQMYRVNEGASPGNVEAFVPSGSGNIIPLGQMGALARQGSTQRAVVQLNVMEGQLFEPRVQAISGDVSVQVVRGVAPQLIDASAREAMARASRTRM